MKDVLIKIPDNTYKVIKDDIYCGILDLVVYDAVKTGKALDELSNGELITCIINPDSEDCVGIECKDGIVTFQVTQDAWDRKFKTL